MVGLGKTEAEGRALPPNFLEHGSNERIKKEKLFMPLKYHKEHAWVSIDGDQGTVGISDYAQQQLGEIIYVDLPEIDTEIKVGEPLCTLESNKVATDVIAPVSGVIRETNGSLDEQPKLINSSPYEAGWLVKMVLKNPSELDELMDQPAYEQHIASK